MTLTPEQWERADQIAAWCMGGAESGPLTHMTEDEKANREFLERVDEQVFYCENCGYYWDTDDKHETEHGEICVDCAKELGAIDE